MTKSEAKKLVEDMTWGEIKDLLQKAYTQDAKFSYKWNKRSKCNKSFTKGAIFNIFWKGISDQSNDKKVGDSLSKIAAANIMYEFGELAGFSAPPKKYKKLPPAYYEDPVKPEQEARRKV
jgi:hypothetical protein